MSNNNFIRRPEHHKLLKSTAYEEDATHNGIIVVWTYFLQDHGLPASGTKLSLTLEGSPDFLAEFQVNLLTRFGVILREERYTQVKYRPILMDIISDTTAKPFQKTAHFLYIATGISSKYLILKMQEAS